MPNVIAFVGVFYFITGLPDASAAWLMVMLLHQWAAPTSALVRDWGAGSIRADPAAMKTLQQHKGDRTKWIKNV
ncbi:hypothetical protein [Paenibacillus sp. MY03]|uniref:hypothetical protein n=1 Tax=Paenibacillus sp. MY03 TaxID=302980 RepID=UPI0011816C1B|nr:hypothetical protein [Paenibacillus sp. MY03]